MRRENTSSDSQNTCPSGSEASNGSSSSSRSGDEKEVVSGDVESEIQVIEQPIDPNSKVEHEEETEEKDNNKDKDKK